MKARNILFVLVAFVFFSCGNSIFQNLTGVEDVKNVGTYVTFPSDTSDGNTNQLGTPTITYDNGYLKWNSVTGATSYHIYQGSSPSAASMIYRSETNSLQFYIGTDNYGLYYSVCAYNSTTKKYSDYSNFVQIGSSSSNSNKLETPTVTYSGYYLRWSSVAGATHYQIYYGSSSSPSGMSLLRTVDPTSPQYYLGSGYDGKYFCVRAYDSYTGKYSDYSNVVQIGSSSSSSNKPETPTITYGSDGYLRWNAITGATNYQIYYDSSSSPSSMSLLTTVSSTSTQYYLESSYGGKYFCVRAYNSDTGKYSDYSNVVQMPTIKWTATFVTNGGTAITSYKTDIIKECPTPSRDGYSFVGWYTDSGFKNSVTFPYTLNRDTTFYAKWNHDFIFNLKIKSYTNKSLSLSWDLYSDSKYSYDSVSYIYIYIDDVLVDGFHKDSINGGVWKWSKENLSFTTGTHSVNLSATGSGWSGRIKASDAVQFTVN